MRHSHSTPGGKRRRKESSDDDFADSEGFEPPNAVRTEELTVGRHSIRNAPRAVDYSTFDSDDGQSDSDSEEEEEAGIFGNGKIDKIFMVRQASSGIEYLVSFQESCEPFSQWVSRELLLEFPNASRSIQRFSEIEMEWSFYDTEAHAFAVSYASPVHAIAHRPMNNDPRPTRSSSSASSPSRSAPRSCGSRRPPTRPRTSSPTTWRRESASSIRGPGAR
jgi:hypothetical protein